MDTRGERSAANKPPTAPDVRIEATNFGPIKRAAVDLRPLTVFVGPSNTGKTYFAVLIYALYRVLGGFRALLKRVWVGRGPIVGSAGFRLGGVTAFTGRLKAGDGGPGVEGAGGMGAARAGGVRPVISSTVNN